MKAYQVYDTPRDEIVTPVFDNGKREFKCYCSECGCPIYSKYFPSERAECPHCHAEFAEDRIMRYDAWTADLNHVGYTEQECGRDQ